jgi:hypothetical protein
MALGTVGVQKAREVLAQCRDRDLFASIEVETEAYNSLLWHVNSRDREDGAIATMDEILKVRVHDVVCVCVCERERERECVCVRVSLSLPLSL